MRVNGSTGNPVEMFCHEFPVANLCQCHWPSRKVVSNTSTAPLVGPPALSTSSVIQLRSTKHSTLPRSLPLEHKNEFVPKIYHKSLLSSPLSDKLVAVLSRRIRSSGGSISWAASSEEGGQQEDRYIHIAASPPGIFFPV